MRSCAKKRKEKEKQALQCECEEESRDSRCGTLANVIYLFSNHHFFLFYVGNLQKRRCFITSNQNAHLVNNTNIQSSAEVEALSNTPAFCSSPKKKEKRKKANESLWLRHCRVMQLINLSFCTQHFLNFPTEAISRCLSALLR